MNVNEILERSRRGEINYAERSKTRVLSQSDLDVLKKQNILWLCIDDKVYDIGGWLDKHPGGSLIFLHFLYRDATDQFNRFHPAEVKEKILPNLQIGILEKPMKIHTPLMKDFRKIEEDLYKEGLFETNYNFYYLETIKGLIAIISGILMVIYGPATYLNYIVAAFLIGFCWHQLSFVAHDTGHNAVTHKLIFDHYYGVFLASCLSGLSIGWWKDSHNIHHVVTNDPVHDPDIQHLPFLAVSEKFFEGVHSTYHNKQFKIDAFSKILLKAQHVLYYIIMMFGRFNLYVQSVKFILINERAKFRKSELAAMIFFIIWITKLLSIIPCWKQRLVFFFLVNAITFLLHVQITLSHFCMNTDNIDENEDFVHHQLRTSMDVDCSEWLDWLHGGLQFQVIHHLFPRLPRHNLRKVRDRMIPFFKKHGITYHCYDFKLGNIMVIKHLAKIADNLKEFISNYNKVKTI